VKKINFIFFIPAIILALLYLVVAVMTGDFVAPIMLLYIVLLTISAILMAKGKAWGSLFGIGYFAFVMTEDYLRNYKRGWIGEMREYRYCIPMIIFYIVCAIIVIVRNIKNKKTAKKFDIDL